MKTCANTVRNIKRIVKKLIRYLFINKFTLSSNSNLILRSTLSGIKLNVKKTDKMQSYLTTLMKNVTNYSNLDGKDESLFG